MALLSHRPGYQALRKGRWSQSNQVYPVTTVTHRRGRRFLDWRWACIASSVMADPRSWPDADLLCWVLMPDHWHGMVRLRSKKELGALVRVAKGRAARAINLASRRSGPVWMPGFHDRGLRGEESLIEVARYIVANPLRAGLTDRIGDYPYWDSVWLSPGERDISFS